MPFSPNTPEDDYPTSHDTPPSLELPTASEDEESNDSDPAATGRPRARIAVIIAVILGLLVVGGGLGFFFANRNGAPTPDAIAKVGDTIITRREFERNYQGGAAGQDGQQTMDQLVQIELLVQEAKRADVKIVPADIDAQVEQIRQSQAGGDPQRFLEFLKSANIDSEADLRTLLTRQQYIQAMILKHTTMEQVRSRHILLAGDTEEAIQARKGEAEALLAQIQAGGDFAALAKEKSDDPGSKDKGGDLGWVPRGAFVTEFEDAIFSMKANEVRLVKSQFGWHIIQVQDPAQVRELDSQDFLQTPSGQQAFADTFLLWIEDLQKKAVEAKQVVIYVTPDVLVKSIPTSTPLPAVPSIELPPSAPTDAAIPPVDATSAAPPVDATSAAPSGTPTPTQ